jgi:hypothetical protein
MRELRRLLTFIAYLYVTGMPPELCLVAGLGGNNLFGIFRKRRLSLHRIQELRETHAERNGFAGPHGQALTGSEAQELLNRRRQSGWNSLRNWIQQRFSSTSKNPNQSVHEEDGRK